jgi:hypothetical protein
VILDGFDCSNVVGRNEKMAKQGIFGISNLTIKESEDETGRDDESHEITVSAPQENQLKIVRNRILFRRIYRMIQKRVLE